MSVVDSIIRGAKKEAQDVKTFIQTPKGPFETVDAMVRDARQIVFDSLRAVGVPRPIIGGYSVLQGQMPGKPLQKLRDRVKSARSNMMSRY